MEDQVYSNMDILNLFYIHGECLRIVGRTCRTFNDRYPHLPPMNKNKFKRIESNFLHYGKAKCTGLRQKPITGEEVNEINVLAYFNAHPSGSIRSAVQDLGISYYAIQCI